jgi:hypothetical protein
MDIMNLDEVPAVITKDGSEIRELLAHHSDTVLTEPGRKDLAC